MDVAVNLSIPFLLRQAVSAILDSVGAECDEAKCTKLLTALQGKLEPLLQSEATNMRVPGHWAVLEQLVVEARTRFSTADAPPVMLWGDF